MLLNLFGFIFGFLTPLIGSRFGKIVPNDCGTMLVLLPHKPYFHNFNKRLMKKWKKLLLFCLGWAVFLSVLFCFVSKGYFGENIGWIVCFFSILSLLTVIDQQYFLLPDFLTIPLLILGFGYASYTDAITVKDAFMGASYGYLLPLLTVAATYKCFPDGFGGGDIKMLSAIGAWFGIIGLSITLVLSAVSFLVLAIIQKKRALAYGPHLSLACLIYLFLLNLGFFV